MNIEKVILTNLIHNDEFGKKVIPFLKSEYFQDYSEKIVFELINDYVEKYSSFPSIEALAIDLSNKDGLNEDAFKSGKEVIAELTPDSNTKLEWLLDQTEQFCQDRSLYLAVMQTIKIMDEKNGSISKGSIPNILSDEIGRAHV